jgi:hypothetical protein
MTIETVAAGRCLACRRLDEAHALDFLVQLGSVHKRSALAPSEWVVA